MSILSFSGNALALSLYRVYDILSGLYALFDVTLITQVFAAIRAVFGANTQRGARVVIDKATVALHKQYPTVMLDRDILVVHLNNIPIIITDGN